MTLEKSAMQIHKTELPEVLVVEPRVFEDGRGFFKETYQKQRYAESGIGCEFVQDNYSRSCRGTLRGLHFQIERPQAKLIQCLRGKIFDVAVDVRRDSPRFGHWTGQFLSDENHLQLYVPAGFAHGFAVVSEIAEISYKCDDYYFPEHERTLIWNDARVAVDWPIDGDPILSEKDRQGLPLEQVETYRM
jgi:dTDP-4-dehydrorhamnose 3,5-epimerase